MVRLRGTLVVALVLVLGLGGWQAKADPTSASVHFTAAGDYGANANSTAVLNKISALQPDLNLALGDLSYGVTGQEQAWCNLVTGSVGEGFPFELVSGNHEAGGQNGNINDFSACLTNQLPGAGGTYGREWYVDVPKVNPLVRFVMVSPSLDFGQGAWSYDAGSPHYQWTAGAIDGARAKGVPWVVVGMHKPCLSAGTYGCDIGKDLMNLLGGKKVDLVLTGHDHTYQRTKQLSLNAGCAAITPLVYDAGCVADSDSTLNKGAGTVWATVATGGADLYSISTSDPEYPYFVTTSGANKNPTWGVLDVHVTADTLQADFARASGGTLTDSFTISTSASPPNSPPTAAFTKSCTQLTCAFDASGSSDPDGTIASYRWDFGDSTTGSSATASHTYAAAGTYPVTLAVTDDGGASATSTSSVSVSAPVTTTYASDDFTRTVTGGWGTTPVGGAWTPGSTTESVNGVGQVRLNPSNGPTVGLGAVSAPSTDLIYTASLDKVPTGNGFYLTTVVRKVGSSQYQVTTRFTSTGQVLLSTAKVVGGVTTTLVPEGVVGGLTVAAGQQVRIRAQAVDGNPTLLRAKVWRVGATEPPTWQASGTDSTTGLQSAGSVGLVTYLSSSAVNGPVTLSVDDLLVTAAH